jgi:GntR family transcriptional repressor for pyruvate dehydrogenase complex
MPIFEPVDSPRISDLITNQIRAAILKGELTPGDRLPAERELVTRFKASRIAVREALKGLEASGLVKIKPGSGVFVAETDSRKMSESLYSILQIQNISLDQVTEARLIFEPQVARLAAERIRREDIEKLEANIKKTERVVKSRSPATSENIEFHTLIAEATQNTVIGVTMKTMLEVAREMTGAKAKNQTRRTKISSHSLESHREILNALKQGSPHSVHELMHEHVVRIQRDLKKAMTHS